MFNATFALPYRTTFCRLDELGLEAVGQRLVVDWAFIASRVAAGDPWRRNCGAEGVPRDTMFGHLADEPFFHRPTIL